MFIKPYERKYDKNIVATLFGKSAGHCTLCNRSICYDKYSHKNISTAEIAHIRAFSDLGPRADKKLPKSERNKIENLILLCGECHSTIDKKIAEKLYTVEWLKNAKEQKERAIIEIMSCLTPKELYCIKCFSAIDSSKFGLNSQDLLRECFQNRIYVSDMIIDLCTNNCIENPKINISQLDYLIKEKIKPFIENGYDKNFCLFALGPQYFLINLGYKLSDKSHYIIFTRHRDKWILNKETKQQNDFDIIKPNHIDKANEVALIISSTTKINHDRVSSILNKNVDIWEICAQHIGIDKINTINELNKFQQICSVVIDEIGSTYGKEKTIHLFSAMCNSLCIKFGQSIFHKSHNKISIYDTIKNKSGRVIEKKVLTL